MRRLVILFTLVWLTIGADPASATELILWPQPQASVSRICARHGWTLLRTLEKHELYLVETGRDTTQRDIDKVLRSDNDIRNLEFSVDLTISERDSSKLQQSVAAILEANAQEIIPSYGTSVWSSYANQNAAGTIGVGTTHGQLATGAGIIAIIDTGVDPHHPALQNVLVAGYDFTTDTVGASEWNDLAQSVAAILEQSVAAILEQLNAPVLQQSVAAILEGYKQTAAKYPSQLPLFGHGTMVAGLVHLVAPTAQIMPLKAFRGDGKSSLFDVVEAVYYAADNGATVINMSFTMRTTSRELSRALTYAHQRGVVAVAAVGNQGLAYTPYPGAYRNSIAVGSTVTQNDHRADFSNYGDAIALAAPGTRLITTFPGGRYAEVAGTSFSTAFVAGAVALLEQIKPGCSLRDVREALNQARKLPTKWYLGAGRLDVWQAAWYMKTRTR